MTSGLLTIMVFCCIIHGEENTKTMEIFIKAGALKDPKTPLEYATKHGHKDIEKRLIAAGADVVRSGRK